MWLNILGMGARTAIKLYSDKNKTKEAISTARLLQAEKMASGELEYSGKLLESRNSDWKDEFILLLLSLPIGMLAFSVWSDNPVHMEKMNMFFEHFGNLPFWYQTIFVGVIASVYGLKATDLIKRK
jgi:hypothetical protein